ncbi:MAG TPA: DASS family sodium-coupled anion symporter [Chitinophagaceae bacterium]|nr:DASS family sodium-coupled anion symporter [Chitinophagaceae bacterium]
MSSQQRKFISLLSGIIVALLLFFINPFHVSGPAATVLAIAGLMITWWVTEALPMPVVALLPLILFPLLKISKLDETAAPYANPVIFLFMGGFMLGLAIEKWNLHRRIALNIVRLTGTSGNQIILGFILATGLLSMWLSNTATTMMMFPIALSVIQVMKENHTGEGSTVNFSLVLMMVIAFASNMSIGTIIGTPPNTAYVAHIEQRYHYTVDFMRWMLLCTPLSILLLVALYVVLVKWLYPNRIRSNPATKKLILEELHSLGPISVPEKRVLIVFITTALLWMTKDIINASQPLFKLDDTIIALLCTVTLFICPAGNVAQREENNTNISLLEWGDTKRMAWGILLLFGGGIALATALEKANLVQDLGTWLGQFAGNGFVLVLAITFVSLFLSEVMSNVAQVIVFAPVVSSLADAVGMDPLLLGIPMTLAASCASMLPMGTPPNAIVFASGHIKLKQMAKAGFVMNIVSIILITLFCWFILPVLMKIG